MISKKNIYNLEKTKNFFKEYPFIMIYQHNNLTVKQSIDLKVRLESLNNIKMFTVKNSIVDKVCCSFLQNKQVKKQIQNLLQGPLFLLGCHNIEQVKTVWNVLKTSSSFLFLGGQFDNQVYTHLDLEKSLEINNTIYYDLLNIFDQQLNFQNSGFFCLTENNYNILLEKTSISNTLLSILEKQADVSFRKYTSVF